MRALRTHLSFANVMSCLALFVALGGVSYAAIKLPRDSVSSKQIRDGQVRKRDIGRNAVDSARIADGSLTARDFGPGQLPGGAGGDRGPAGPVGPAGADGAPGSAGRDGAALVTTGLFTGEASPPQGGSALIPAATATWTQPANALDYFFARIRIIRTALTNCDQAGQTFEAHLKLDNLNASVQEIEVQESGTHVLALKPPYTWLVPPGAPTERKLEVYMRTNCPDGPAGWRVQEARIDVVRAYAG